MATLAFFIPRLKRGTQIVCAGSCLFFSTLAAAQTAAPDNAQPSGITRTIYERRPLSGNPYAARRAVAGVEKQQANAPPEIIAEPVNPAPDTAHIAPDPRAATASAPLKIVIPNLKALHQTPAKTAEKAAPVARAENHSGSAPNLVSVDSNATFPHAEERKHFALNLTPDEASNIEEIISREEDTPRPKPVAATTSPQITPPSPPATPAVQLHKERFVAPNITPEELAASQSSQMPDPIKIVQKILAEQVSPASLDRLTPTAGNDPQDADTPMITLPAAPTELPKLPAESFIVNEQAQSAITPLLSNDEIIATPVSPQPIQKELVPEEIAPPLPPSEKAKYKDKILDEVAEEILPEKNPPVYSKKPLDEPMSFAKSASSEPQLSLSPQSKKIAGKIPANIDRRKQPKEYDQLTLDHSKDLGGKPKLDNVVKVETVTSEIFGTKIQIRNGRNDMSLEYELEKAYNALISGQSAAAIEIYKNVLQNDENNQNALFGLATTYHRAGQIDQARTLYAKLLAINPRNSDALNNFLVLMADEAPEQALVQLAELEKRSPDFSPIPAQMAVIYQKLGDVDKASEKMFRAIALAPENLTFRYNLAIMLDKQKKYDEAANLYKQLVQAALRGEVIPGNLQKIQERLTFISSNRQ